MRQLKNKLILISIIIFIASLFFTAFKVIEPKEIKVFSSAELLLLGPISFVGGSVLEFFIWTANFWLLISIVCVYSKKFFISIVTGIIALSISGSFTFWKEVLVSESGRMGKIYSLEAGYFLWLASILFITFSSIYLKINKKIKAKNFTNINRNGL
ncbi:hypothetical protein SAMN05421841_0428 [Chryseobacterium wanjuense]|jgi:hypothetical protein|uniref:Uncharacterized protein n=1 Tax=Chryseobacterium wanjuense TaxID=356305 RepID=A0A1I0N7Q9_9FLAO|nr:hypothetical protein [Chryseobacterium wanjuense]SEV97198.1 hypothetical protein SAMN05421841_0428 [Chryseobacterium wanjuense]